MARNGPSRRTSPNCRKPPPVPRISGSWLTLSWKLQGSALQKIVHLIRQMMGVHRHLETVRRLQLRQHQPQQGPVQHRPQRLGTDIRQRLSRVPSPAANTAAFTGASPLVVGGRG